MVRYVTFLSVILGTCSFTTEASAGRWQGRWGCSSCQSYQGCSSCEATCWSCGMCGSCVEQTSAREGPTRTELQADVNKLKQDVSDLKGQVGELNRKVRELGSGQTPGTK